MRKQLVTAEGVSGGRCNEYYSKKNSEVAGILKNYNILITIANQLPAEKNKQAVRVTEKKQSPVRLAFQLVFGVALKGTYFNIAPSQRALNTCWQPGN